ncbi:MAG: hypothetical protein ABI571_00085 [Actinomycetota bacterium]
MTSRHPPQNEPFTSRSGRVLLVLGSAVMAFGIAGLFVDGNRTNPDQWARWFFGALIAHDLVVAPVVFAVAFVVHRSTGGRLRRVLQAGLVATGIVVLTVYPFLRGYGRRDDNPSVLPNDYLASVLWVVGSIWIALAVWALLRAHTRRP